MYEFDNAEGHHIHSVLSNPPYEHNKKLSCQVCIDAIEKFRQELCEKYGWGEWPSDLSVI